MENKWFEKNKTFGSWYDVYYIPNLFCVADIRPHKDCGSQGIRKAKLICENFNGWGKGTAFFTNEDNQLVVLDWCQIICMLPYKRVGETDDKSAKAGLG